MGVSFIHPFKRNVADKTNTDGKQEKEYSIHNYGSRIGFRIFKADNKGKHDNTDNIVNNCGAENGGSHLPLQFSHFLQGFHRNADGCGCENNSYKYRLIKLFRSPWHHTIKSHI